MNNNDNDIEKKEKGATAGITRTVLGFVAFAAAKALTDKETREKIIDTFFEIKKKLSDSTKNAKIENLKEENLRSVTDMHKQRIQNN